MNDDSLYSRFKYAYYLTNISKSSGYVILGNSGKYFSVYKLQDKTEYGLIKTQLISSISCFNFGDWNIVGVSLQKPSRDASEKYTRSCKLHWLRQKFFKSVVSKSTALHKLTCDQLHPKGSVMVSSNYDQPEVLGSDRSMEPVELIWVSITIALKYLQIQC